MRVSGLIDGALGERDCVHFGLNVSHCISITMPLNGHGPDCFSYLAAERALQQHLLLVSVTKPPNRHCDQAVMYPEAEPGFVSVTKPLNGHCDRFDTAVVIVHHTKFQ